MDEVGESTGNRGESERECVRDIDDAFDSADTFMRGWRAEGLT